MNSPNRKLFLAAAALGAAYAPWGAPGTARAQEITPVWLQQINGTTGVAEADKLPILRKPAEGEIVIAQPGGTYREGREGIQNFARLIPYNAEKLLLAVMENGIDEQSPDVTPAQTALAAQYPDRSLIWLDAATSKPMGLAWKESMTPADTIGYDVTAPNKGYQLSKVYQLWRPALDENPDPTKRAIYSGYKHLILRYAPKADGTGWENTPTIAWEEPVPGLQEGGGISPAAGIGDGLSGTGSDGGEAGSWRSFRWRNIRVTGSGANTVIYAGGGTWRIASHPQVFSTADGLTFRPFARVNDRDEGRRNAFSLGGTSSRVVTPGTDPTRPNLQVVYHGHYPGTGWEARPNRYTSNPAKPSPSPEYNQQPDVRMFQGDEAAGAGTFPAFVWEAAGKDGVPLNRDPGNGPVDGVDRYDGNWNMSLDANNALPYLVGVSSSAYDVGFQTKGWVAVHRLDGSIASGNSSYLLPFQEDEVTIDYGGQLDPDLSATEAWVQVVPDTTAPANLNKSIAYVSLENAGFGVFTIQNTPATLVSGPSNATVSAGEDVTISANVTGSPNDFQWYRNGVPLPKAPYYLGAKKASLTIKRAVASDAGVYQLKWTNPLSGAGQTGTATLTVTGNGSFVRWAQDDTGTDVGAVPDFTQPGSLEVKAGSFVMNAGGLSAFNNTNPSTGEPLGDSQYFRYETLVGDFDKKVRLMSLTTTSTAEEAPNRAARAGLILRQSLNPQDKVLELSAWNPIGENNLRVAGRSFFAQNYSQRLSRVYGGVADNLPNQWLRVKRVGNSFLFYVGTDGVNWSVVGEQYEVYPESVLFGTFAAPDAADGLSIATAEFADYGDVIPADTVPPVLVSVGTIDKTTVGVKFSEQVNSLSATMLSNYMISQGTITAARPGIGGNAVYLTVAGLTADTFTVSVHGVVDTAGNAVAAGSWADGRVSNWTATDIGYIQDPANRPTIGDDPYVIGQSVAVSSDANPEIEIVGGGTNSWNSGDYIHYLYRQMTGDFDVAVAVDRYDRRGYQGGYANAGLRVRPSLYIPDNDLPGKNTQVPTYVNVTYFESSDPNRLIIELQRLTDNAGYGNRTPYDNNTVIPEENGLKSFFPMTRTIDAAGSISPDSDPAQAKWIRIKRVGQNFSSLVSYDGVNWKEQDADPFPMANLPATVLVGFGVMNDSGAGEAPNSSYGGTGTIDPVTGFNAQNASNYSTVRIRALGPYTPQGPSLTVTKNGGHAMLWWPGTRLILQQSANLTTWTNSVLPIVTLSGVNSVAVPPPLTKMYFRLVQE